MAVSVSEVKRFISDEFIAEQNVAKIEALIDSKLSDPLWVQNNCVNAEQDPCYVIKIGGRPSDEEIWILIERYKKAGWGRVTIRENHFSQLLTEPFYDIYLHIKS